MSILKSCAPALAALLAVTPASAATLIKATFAYDLYLDDGSTDVLQVTALFDATDALLSDDGSWLMFPDDGGEGTDRLKSFSFSGAGLSSSRIAGFADLFRSVFFDVSVYGGGTVFDPAGGSAFAYTAFAEFGTDAAGCAVGLTPVYFGLGAGDDGACRSAAYDGGAPTSFAFERIEDGGGPAGVPEPAAWALMIAGFGLAGAALRRRRPVAA